MLRRFDPFDEEVIIAEMRSLPAKDLTKLIRAQMAYMGLANTSPNTAIVGSYGGGIYRIKHSDHDGHGRGLFCRAGKDGNIEVLVLLTIYKKEKEEVPANILKTAKARKKQWEEAQK